MRRAVVGFGLAFAWLALACAGAPLPPDVNAAGATSPRSEDSRAGNPWFASGAEIARQSRTRAPDAGAARSVILFVGDGMGMSTITAARILEGQRRGESGEGNRLSFETFPGLALAKVYTTSLQVPDSAGTMTAMISGVKTQAFVIGVDESVRFADPTSVATSLVPTLLEEAERRGLATGVVTTTSVTHATPAACYAHSPSRLWEDDANLTDEARAADFPDIARQLVEFGAGDGIEVVLGGGRSHFMGEAEPDPEHLDAHGRRTDGRDLIEAWQARFPDGSYVWNSEQLARVPLASTTHLLGLFEPVHMRFEADRGGDPAGEPSLSEMTVAALDILQRDPDGFFLMVEGGRIDHAHHAGNAYRALGETIELSDAVRAALERVDLAETLIVVTADHGHVLTMSGYPHRGNDILGLARLRPDGEPLEDGLGLPYTTLGYANGPGYTGATDTQPEGPKRFSPAGPEDRVPPEVKGIARGRPDLRDVDTGDPSFLQEATVPLVLETHSGEDVPVYATGPGAGLFWGVQEQSYVYHAMRAALGWDD